ncbi:Clp1/GlmU family protein [Thermococcus peptonophilus]|uniref:polynucleotide 5'-hydroxyl-kinase n=1 Tax=Thermococcus peptonophilus TaxID=53952 RepID=A0A142CUR0_9EURY|nr:Clp1/GlmU family protein [Thermococcus peptonophilus]AMQ18512.1 polyhydroxyalkanoate depolymerase [Thermococcus peptonophilus]
MNKARYTQDVPEDRIELLKSIARHDKPFKLMVIGGVDSGKSTLITFLANELLSLGFKVAVVDSDVGQKGVLPPATITLAIPEVSFESMSELEGVAHYFVGTTAPAQFTGEMAVGVKRMVELVENAVDVVLIDTTGFVTGLGAEMKRLKAELVRPDIIAVIHSGELSGLVKALKPYGEVVELAVSKTARRYPLEERRNLRAEKWRYYFRDSQLVEFSVSEVAITGTSLFHGIHLNADEKELLERTFGWLVVAGWKNKGYTVVKADVERFPRAHSRELKAIDFEKLSNLLVGLIDGEGLCLGAGILKWVNFSEGMLQILTPVRDLSGVREIRFGRIRVTEEGEELGLLRRDEL